MTKYVVTFTSMIIEAEDEDEAIERACEFKGGGHWEAKEVKEPLESRGRLEEY